MKRVQHIFIKYKDRYGHPPTSLSDLGSVRLSSSEKQYAKRLLQGIRQRMSRRNPSNISKEKQQKLLILLKSDEIENVILGFDLLDTLEPTLQDLYDMFNNGQAFEIVKILPGFLEQPYLSKFRDFANASQVYITVLCMAAELGDQNVSLIDAIDLRGESIEMLPDNIGALKNLQRLNLQSNKLVTLPESIGDLAKLYKLNISRNKLISLPDSIGDLTSLSGLDLSFNENLEVLPETMQNLIELRKLEARNCSIKKLPHNMGMWKDLRVLEMYWNKLTSLPNSIGNLQNITDLDFRHNMITSLPESIGLMTYDYEKINLDLSENQLTTLPTNFGKFGNKLRVLNLSRNNLSSLPKSFSQIMLNELNLETNNFKEIDNLPNYVKELNLSDNRLGKIPEELKELGMLHLKVLNLEANQIKEIPSFLGKFWSLEELRFSYNQITSIDFSIFRNLSKLVLVDYGSIPDSLDKKLEHTLKNLGFRYDWDADVYIRYL